MNRVSFIATVVAVAGGLLAAPAQAAISRTYVASFGSDTNSLYSCDFAHPCRTFQTAFSQVTTGGEILAIDGSGYGPITIDRSVSIIANPGVFAGIGVFSGAGVTIATAGVNVVLRGLTFNGQGGNYGIDMSNGNRLSIENCVFSGFSVAATAAIYVHTAATVNIINTLARDNANGVTVSSGAAASISASQFLGNTTIGINVNAGSATVSASMVTRNGTGLSNVGGTLKSLGNNNVTDNTTATVGTITGTPLM
jgi:hypothetical protein